MSRSARARTGFAVACLLPLLSGCAAAVAIPLVTGGALYMRDKAVRVRAATPIEPGQRLAAPAVRPPESSAVAGPAPQVVVTDLTELPPPTGPRGAVAADPWEAFVGYALAQAAAVREAGRQPSALLVPGSDLLRPERRPCTARYPAVILDLDAGGVAFAPERARQPAPGLAERLARLRAAQIVVLWLSELPAARVADVADALRESRLDPEGDDQLLLIRGPDDRKQVLREQANEDVCVVALAGDRRADFDELFDYLREPETAIGLDEMLGRGWFLVPPPLAAP